MQQTPSPLVLVVLDGWGLSTSRDHNAIALARTPAYRELVERYPHHRAAPLVEGPFLHPVGPAARDAWLAPPNRACGDVGGMQR